MEDWLSFSELEDNVVKRKNDLDYWIIRFQWCAPDVPPELKTGIDTLVECKHKFLFWKWSTWQQEKTIVCTRCGKIINNDYHVCTDVMYYYWQKKREEDGHRHGGRSEA